MERTSILYLSPNSLQGDVAWDVGRAKRACCRGPGLSHPTHIIEKKLDLTWQSGQTVHCQSRGRPSRGPRHWTEPAAAPSSAPPRRPVLWWCWWWCVIFLGGGEGPISVLYAAHPVAPVSAKHMALPHLHSPHALPPSRSPTCVDAKPTSTNATCSGASSGRSVL